LTYTVKSLILCYQIGGFSSLPFELLLSQGLEFLSGFISLVPQTMGISLYWFYNNMRMQSLSNMHYMHPNKNMSFCHLIVEFWCYQEIWQIWKWWQAQATNSCSSSEKKISRTKAGQATS